MTGGDFLSSLYIKNVSLDFLSIHKCKFCLLLIWQDVGSVLGVLLWSFPSAPLYVFTPVHPLGLSPLSWSSLEKMVTWSPWAQWHKNWSRHILPQYLIWLNLSPPNESSFVFKCWSCVLPKIKLSPTSLPRPQPWDSLTRTGQWCWWKVDTVSPWWVGICLLVPPPAFGQSDWQFARLVHREYSESLPWMYDPRPWWIGCDFLTVLSARRDSGC